MFSSESRGNITGSRVILIICSTSNTNYHKNDGIANYISTIVRPVLQSLGKAKQPDDNAGVLILKSSYVTLLPSCVCHLILFW